MILFTRMGFLSGGGGVLSIGEGLCPGGVSVQGVSVREAPPPYGNMQAVRILLECILVSLIYQII